MPTNTATLPRIYILVLFLFIVLYKLKQRLVSEPNTMQCEMQVHQIDVRIVVGQKDAVNANSHTFLICFSFIMCDMLYCYFAFGLAVRCQWRTSGVIMTRCNRHFQLILSSLSALMVISQGGIILELTTEYSNITHAIQLLWLTSLKNVSSFCISFLRNRWHTILVFEFEIVSDIKTESSIDNKISMVDILVLMLMIHELSF